MNRSTKNQQRRASTDAEKTRLRISLILDRERNLLFNEAIDEGQIDRVLRFVERLRPAATSINRATTDENPSERREFMRMAFDAFASKTAKHSKAKTRFIKRLLANDVDAKTVARLNRALDANPRQTG